MTGAVPRSVVEAYYQAYAARDAEAVAGFLDDDVQTDFGIGRQERRHQSRQYQARRAGGHIEPQRAGGTVPEAVDHVECRFDLPECRTDPFQQPRTDFDRRFTALRR